MNIYNLHYLIQLIDIFANIEDQLSNLNSSFYFFNTFILNFNIVNFLHLSFKHFQGV
jgi:hypothetical protein